MPALELTLPLKVVPALKYIVALLPTSCTSGDATRTYLQNNAAAINNIPTQDGLNIYSLKMRGKKYSVLAQVTNNTIVWASIAGGGNVTWASPVLYIGGLN